MYISFVAEIIIVLQVQYRTAIALTWSSFVPGVLRVLPNFYVIISCLNAVTNKWYSNHDVSTDWTPIMIYELILEDCPLLITHFMWGNHKVSLCNRISGTFGITLILSTEIWRFIAYYHVQQVLFPFTFVSKTTWHYVARTLALFITWTVCHDWQIAKQFHKITSSISGVCKTLCWYTCGH